MTGWFGPIHGNGPARDWIALVLTALACPVALAAQWAAGCAGQGANAYCATTFILVAPILLLIAGVLDGIATRGWTGLLVVYVGGAIGMTSILGLAAMLGRDIPFDPMSGIVATIWFMAPVTAGYVVARLAWHVREWLTGRGSPTT